MDKYIIFINTFKAMLRLRKAIDLGFPAYCIDKLDAEVGTCFDELERNNLVNEYMDFVLN